MRWRSASWNGNSDNTPVSTPQRPVFSIDVPTFVWQGFLQEASAKWEITRFSRPESGLTQVAVDPFTGMLPRGSGETGGSSAAPSRPLGCQRTRAVKAVLAVKHEKKFPNWLDADRDWLRRAGAAPASPADRTGPGRLYFYNAQFNPYGRTWGVFVARDGCGSPSPSPSCIPLPTPDESGVIPSFEIPSPSGSEVAVPCSPPPATPTPSATATPEPTVEPTPEPARTDAGADAGTHEPTPEPTPTPARAS